MYTSYLDLAQESGRRVHVWPVPYEGTASFGRGTKHGPEAILRASYEIETWDEELRTDLQDMAHFRTMDFFRAPVSGPEDCFREMLQALHRERDPAADLLLTLGGEHSVALAPITFYAEQHPDMVVLQLDAHADLRESFQSSRYSHACVMGRARDQKLPLVQLGIRSLSSKESAYIASTPPNELLCLFAWQLQAPEDAARRVREFIQGRPLYISFDADAYDPAILPGTGTPEPGGIDYGWLQRFWSELFRGGIRLLGLDFCELAPIPAAGVVSESVAVRSINRILACALQPEARG